jgi:hypothetical protein
MTHYSNLEYSPDVRRIASVDGEGKTIFGRHAYTSIAAGDDRGFRRDVWHDGTIRPASPHVSKEPYADDARAANHGLPTRTILEFLLSLPENDSDLFISFAFTYDITKILQDLPIAALREFHDLGGTFWEGYFIAGIPRKYLDIRHGERRIRIWDTFSYWQMSFAKALDSSMALFDDFQKKVIANIKRMKAERSNFDVISDDEIREYCFNECEYLSILYRDMLRHADELGYIQNSHFGPGSIATAFFTAENLKWYLPDRGPGGYLAGLPEFVPIHSYYGGRFEISIQGTVGNLIENDIQSAYPSIAVTLPCLKHGRFRRVSEFESNKWGFYYVGSETSGPWAPFPFRANAETGKAYLNHANKGAIAFVHGGRRWVTDDELRTAREFYGADAIPIYDGWVFDRGCNHRPFEKLNDMYLWRKVGNPSCKNCTNGVIDKEGKTVYFCPEHDEPSDGLSKVIKLIINSIYGKLAQSIGWKFDSSSRGSRGIDSSTYKAPPFQCYIWAAWITGGTRAKVMWAAMLGGREANCPECKSGEMFRACEKHSTVKSIATDGILSTKDIPELYTHPYELGSWERDEKPDAWLGMPGIYAFRDYGKPDKCEDCRAAGLACDTHKADKKFKRRGLDSRYFPAEHLRAAWERGNWNCRPNEPIRAFMPLALAITRIDGLELYGEWIEMKKVVKFRSVEHKRNYPEVNDSDFLIHDGTSIPLESITIPSDVISEPYSPKQTWEDAMRGAIDDMDIAMASDIGQENPDNEMSSL